MYERSKAREGEPIFIWLRLQLPIGHTIRLFLLIYSVGVRNKGAVRWYSF